MASKYHSFYKWNVSDGEKVYSNGKDIKSIERIREIRELAHEINSTNIFSR